MATTSTVGRRRLQRTASDADSTTPASADAAAAAGASAAASSTSLLAPAASLTPSPSPSPSPSPDSQWDLSDLIEQYAAASPAAADDAEEEAEAEAELEAEAEPASEEQREEETAATGDTDVGTSATVAAPALRFGSRTAASAPAAVAKTRTLAPHKRFLTGLLSSVTRHNERVEHVELPARALGGGDDDDSTEIEVSGGGGLYSGLSVRKKGVAASSTPARRHVALAGSLEFEAQRLMEAFEGRPAPQQPTVVRTVKGRGQARAVLHSAAESQASSRASAGVSTVAQAHLHTPEQRSQYAATHDRYRRARGVTLLHHISRAYGIEISIRPAGEHTNTTECKEEPAADPPVGPHSFTITRSVSDPELNGGTNDSVLVKSASELALRARITLQRKRLANAPLATEAMDTDQPAASPSPDPPAAAAMTTAAATRRTFNLDASPAPPAASPSPPPASPNAAAVSTAAPTRKVLALKPRSIPLPELSFSNNAPLLPAAAASSAPVKLQLNRKRKEGAGDASPAAATAASPVPSFGQPVASPPQPQSSPPVPLDPSDASESAPKKPRLVVSAANGRRRGGGILGAALQAIGR